MFAVIIFGSNLEPEFYIPKGLKALNEQVKILSISPVYENPAIGKTASPFYLNGACLVETNFPPLGLHQYVLRPIEDALGRVRGENANGMCTIDLDLVLYEQEVLSAANLELPAPDILRYAFVALLVALLVPDWTHPKTKQTMAEIGERFLPEKLTFYHREDVNLAIETELFTRKANAYND